MNQHTSIAGKCVLAVLLPLAIVACDNQGTVKAKDADNTARNTTDRNDRSSVTPPDQKESEADLARTAEIRKRIVDTKLSVNAQNVKVVTMNGRVTLRGPVKSQAEKDAIEQIARDVAGAGNVDSHLEIESGG
jgi:hyperosmotically inducible protein